MGFSYPLNRNEQRALILGKTKHDTRSLGERIFRTFSSVRSEYAPMEAVNSLNDMAISTSEMTFGFSDKNEFRYLLFKGIAFRQNDTSTNLIEVLKTPIVGRHRPLMGDLMFIANDTHLYHDKSASNFEFPFSPEGARGFTRLLNYQKDIEKYYSEVFGMFEDDMKVYVAAWPPPSQPRDQPRIFLIYDYIPRVNRTWILSQYNEHVCLQFFRFYTTFQYLITFLTID